MRRALVGYSTPIGYDYKFPAVESSDGRREANPILVGSMGLMLLYDEIWFAEEWLCPANMRALPYCRFLNREKTDLAKLEESTPTIDYRSEFKFPNLNDLDKDGYSGFMQAYYGASHPDNHSFSGNPTPENLHRDLALIDCCDDLNFDLAMNDLTHQYLFPERLEYLHARSQFELFELAESALNIVSVYDFTGTSGPYHPVIEPMRESNFLSDFRAWADQKTTKLDNQTADDVLEELDKKVSEFTSGALSAAVGAGGLKETIIDMAKDIALDLVPGAGTVHTAIGLAEAASERPDRRLSAFIADGRSSIHIEQRKADRRKRRARTMEQ